jgi:hypothetical protein
MSTKSKIIVVGVLAIALIVAIPVFAQSFTQQVSPTYQLVDDEGNHVMWLWEVDGYVVSEEGYIACCGECNIEDSEEQLFSTSDVENTPVPTLSPTEEPRESCNRGIGNSSEDCDPGNSSGQGKGQGRRAGEDRDE